MRKYVMGCVGPSHERRLQAEDTQLQESISCTAIDGVQFCCRNGKWGRKRKAERKERRDK
jgi:hypothetical protein